MITKQITVSCDDCMRWEQPPDARTPTQARAYLREHAGWRRFLAPIRSGGRVQSVDLCPECTKHYLEEKKRGIR